jgi:hypothetical protein
MVNNDGHKNEVINAEWDKMSKITNLSTGNNVEYNKRAKGI